MMMMSALDKPSPNPKVYLRINNCVLNCIGLIQSKLISNFFTQKPD